jgi:hypothetical protein
MRVAQIVNNKAHWIFDPKEVLGADTLEQVKARFTPEQVFIDISDQSEVQEGWTYDGETNNFIGPVLSIEEQLNNVIRPIRNAKLNNLQNRVDRYHNQHDSGAETTDSIDTISKIYGIMQQLRDFPATCDPFNPIWPDEQLK